MATSALTKSPRQLDLPPLDFFAWSITIAFAAGTFRALGLWRTSTRVDVVNAVVLGSLAEGRAGDLSSILQASGPALYLLVAREIVQPLEKLLGERDEVREQLQRASTRALIAANRSLRRHAWLDGVTLAAVVFGVVSRLVSGHPNLSQTLAAGAASLLWLSNVRAARSISVRMYAGASALVDSLMDGLEAIQAVAADRKA